MVKDGRMPSPKRINGRVVWDRKLIDQAFDELPGDLEQNPWHDAA
jgi:predicted DNA-binding transcriptional regulator AlpA